MSVNAAEGFEVKEYDYKSRLIISENLTVMSTKKYNWIQKRMWKKLLNVEIEEV